MNITAPLLKRNCNVQQVLMKTILLVKSWNRPTEIHLKTRCHLLFSLWHFSMKRSSVAVKNRNHKSPSEWLRLTFWKLSVKTAGNYELKDIPTRHRKCLNGVSGQKGLHRLPRALYSGSTPHWHWHSFNIKQAVHAERCESVKGRDEGYCPTRAAFSARGHGCRSPPLYSKSPRISLCPRLLTL